MELCANQKLEEIKNKLNELYKQNKNIHVSINDGRRKVKSALTKITGSYTNFICVKSEVNKYMESFTISYKDILIKRIVIDELK